MSWIPDFNVEGVTSTWQLPTLDKELEWSSTLVEVATKVETRMYKPTSSAEVVGLRVPQTLERFEL